MDPTPLLAELPAPKAEGISESQANDSLGQQATQAAPATPPLAQCATQTESAAPRRVGPYELLAELARGGQGVVYKARHTTLGRIVALKTLRTDTPTSPEQALRFGREMRAAASLNHPHIVPIFEVGQDQNQPYFAMAYVPGGTLAEHLPRFRATQEQAVALLLPVVRAVAHAHAQGVLHRDLKPANVLLDAEDRPLVSDFGLARFLDNDEELTQTGTIMGTPAYMAPEQAQGQTSEIGPATDVWALGVILYELLTARRPFTAEKGESIRTRILTASPPPPTSLRPDLSHALEFIVLKCLEKKPQRRYPSAKALADDLERFLHGLPVQGVRPPWYRRRAFLAGAITLSAAGFAAVALLIAGQRSGPVDPTKVSPAQKGEPEIVLIGESGPPRQSRLVYADKKAETSPAGDSPFSSRTAGLCLFELRPSAPANGFKLQAEIRLGDGTEERSAGVYFANARYPVGQGFYQTYWGVSYNERLDPNEGIHRRFAVALSQEGPPWARHVSRVALKTPVRSLSRGGAPGLWRKVVVDVGPGGIQAFWEGERLAAISLAETEARNKDIFDGMGIQAGAFTPEGGLGIFLYEGQASFRNVILTPLSISPDP